MENLIPEKSSIVASKFKNSDELIEYSDGLKKNANCRNSSKRWFVP
jgi:hypothetical protein